MTTMNTQFGIAEESSFGTPVTVSRFYEYEGESVRPQHGRVESKGLRSGARVLRADRFEPYVVGASGRVQMPVPTKGFGLMAKHMFGTAAIGTVSDGNYTQTFTIGSLLGKYITGQINRPFNPSGTNQAMTYHGGKITDWSMSCSVDSYLMADIGFDFEEEDTSTALASASYPSDYRLFSWGGASVTIAGTSIEVVDFSVSMNNSLNTDRRYLRGSTLKKEPVEDGMRSIEFSMTADFTDLTQRNRFTSATRAGALAVVAATFDGPVAHGGTTLPRIVITLDAARFDAVDVNVGGPEALRQTISGVGLYDTAGLTMTYRTTDSAA